MDKNEIIKLYDEIQISWEKHLKDHSVKMPSLYRGNDFTINALVLVYLYKNLGQVVSKKTLTQFLQEQGRDINDVQQGRHLAQQSGWYIISSTRGDIEAEKYGMESGDYMLVAVKEPYPSFANKKRISDLSGKDWEDIKKEYDNKCASCGSEEGKPNRYYRSTVTELQKGHRDPNKPLEAGNIIPQCSKCNQADRNYFIYDEHGRVVAIADPKYISKASEAVQKETLKILLKKYGKDLAD